ncbi:MAG TPA: hypothetical protein VNK95_18710 [Caldilineaceae bacterium]|nr:hypothetical protein [Caldilineaceae bacterium]
MRHDPLDQPRSREPSAGRPAWDALLLALLTVATLQINAFGQAAALPQRVDDVLRHPLLGGLLPPAGVAAMGKIGPAPGDPIGLLLNALALACLLIYLVVDLTPWGRARQSLKWAALVGVLLAALYLPALKLILLRDQSGPASYTHDGGVIQTEATIQYLLEGRNPYVEDYVDTPMAEWGFSEFRTALYHYPYLPWTFLFSAPFYLLGQAAGFYDQRLVYLLLMTLALLLAPRLAAGPRARLALVAALGLNPVMNLDLVFGQNDAFVFCWVLFSLAAWQGWRRSRQMGRQRPGLLLLSTLAYGLACASKPTAWFFAPFYGLLLIADVVAKEGVAKDETAQAAPPGRALKQAGLALIRRGWPAAVAFLLVAGPYVLWDPWAFYDDIWRWSNGLGETGYQIWGWGASNFVLALGLVSDRFDQWPFLILEAALALPLLAWFLMRQWRTNTLGHACWHYGLFLFAFFYGSRFLNENYLGYILAFLTLGLFAGDVGRPAGDPREPNER